MTASVRIACEGAGFVYEGAGAPVLSCVDLVVRDGELWALLGPNGAGKSTLLRLMAGLTTATSGRVSIDGLDARGLAPRERARRVAWVAQQDAAPEGVTAEAFVSLGRAPFTPWHGGLTREDQSRVREAMASAGVEALARRDVSELSGGERRRVTLARARAQGAGVLLFDEPTAFLDPMQQWWVAEAIEKLARDERLAAVMVLHDPAMALRYCTHAALLRGGAVVAQGPVESVLTRELLLRVFDVEARVGRDAESGVPYVVTVRGAGSER
jgi:iron complex transport system ATP-binding protein